MYNEWGVYISEYIHNSVLIRWFWLAFHAGHGRGLYTKKASSGFQVQLLQLHVNASPTYNGRSHDDFVHYANDSDDQRDNAICG